MRDPRHVFNILRRRTMEAEIALPPLLLEGLVGWELVHARTGEVIRDSGRNLDGSVKCWPNIVTNAALEALGTGVALSTLFTYCGVGADNTTPQYTDTALISPVGTRTNSNGGFAEVYGTGASNTYEYRRITRVFLEDNANGNLTEVAFFQLSSGAPMANRQLLKDDQGQPTTIVKTTDHQLRVIQERRVYKMANDVQTMGVTIGGVSTDVTVRQTGHGGVDGLGDWQMWTQAQPNTKIFESDTLPPFGSNFSGNSAGPLVGQSSLTAYSGGSYQKEASIGFEPSVGNWAGGVGGAGFSLIYGGYAPHTFSAIFDPHIAKTNIHRLRLTIRVAWGRV